MGVFAWCVFLSVGFTVGVLCCGWSGGFIEWVVVFHVNILLNYRWTSGTYSNLFVGMIEANSATGKIYLH